MRNDPIDWVDPFGLITVKTTDGVIQVHPQDVDDWPSVPHGHIYDKSQKVNVHTGEIFDKTTRQYVGKLRRSSMKQLTAKLRKAGLIGAMIALAATTAEAAALGGELAPAIQSQAVAKAGAAAGAYAGGAAGG